MKLMEFQDRLCGEWSGTNRLWLDGTRAPELSSPTRMTVAPVARGKFLEVRYTWVYDGVEQEGVLIVGNNNKELEATAGWVDSWHQGGKVMLLRGEVAADGAISVRGAYAAPPDPDWGWRIGLSQSSPDELRLTMHNVTPDGQEELAVEAVYARAKL